MAWYSFNCLLLVKVFNWTEYSVNLMEKQSDSKQSKLQGRDHSLYEVILANKRLWPAKYVCDIERI